MRRPAAMVARPSVRPMVAHGPVRSVRATTQAVASSEPIRKWSAQWVARLVAAARARVAMLSNEVKRRARETR